MNIIHLKISWSKVKWPLIGFSLCNLILYLYFYQRLKDENGENELGINSRCEESTTSGYLGKYLQVNYTVLDNINRDSSDQHSGTVVFINTGTVAVTDNSWEIYFCSLMQWENDILRNPPKDGIEIGKSKIKLYHINGCLNKLQPMYEFEGFKPQRKIQLQFRVFRWTVSRSNIMPRWFVTHGGSKACTILSTASESMDFVSDFASPKQWKRDKGDRFDPFTPQYRFENRIGGDAGNVLKKVIPTPVKSTVSKEKFVDITTDHWVVIYRTKDLTKEAHFLASSLDMKLSENEQLPKSHFIYINLGQVDEGKIDNKEAYELHISADTPVITILGTSAVGVFYGIQTLLSLAAGNLKVPENRIIDYPRFPYRGMHVDVSRNFLSKKAVIRLLDVMAMYKMNKFHFHLTDDDGWRLQIPGIEEATQVGGKRCFDLKERHCVMSQLGSGPSNNTSGSGFYTVDEYKEILQFAADRHIQLIPEFDMPGHSHAIIKAVNARYHKYKYNDVEKSKAFLLTDPNDSSKYMSAQKYTDNVINPCIDSTYRFVQHLIKQIKQIHQDIQPLKVFHFGGDEVPEGAWMNSSICREFVESQGGSIQHSKPDLAKYFSSQLAKLAQKDGLDIAGWEEAFGHELQPFDRSLIPNKNAYVYIWNNVWEKNVASKAYKYANKDYKVILAHATHLYFDHPQEPDPEERGLLWAARYIDTYKTFSYMPDDVYKNIDITRMGDPIDQQEFCKDENACIKLDETKRGNILGMQAEVWSETLRSTAHFESMLYPRLLAVAERAWHKAEWENLNDKQRKDKDWEEFANTLGYKELARLDKVGVEYYIPLPGARIKKSADGSILEANVQFPGLPILYSTDEQKTWLAYRKPIKVPSNITIYLKIRSLKGNRYSRAVKLKT